MPFVCNSSLDLDKEYVSHKANDFSLSCHGDDHRQITWASTSKGSYGTHVDHYFRGHLLVCEQLP